jgi:flagellar hook-length control protein FliK
MMSTDLFFSQPTARIQPCGNQSDKTGTTSLDRSVEPKTAELSPKGDGDNFLTTLKKVSRDRTPQNGPTDAGRSGLPETTKTALSGKTDETSNFDADQKDLIPLNGVDTGPVKIPTDGNFMAFIRMLQEVGSHDANGGSDLPNLTVANAVDGDELAALEVQVVRFQQNHFAPITELKAGFEHLRQFISGAQVAQTLPAIDGNPVKGLNSNQVSNPAQLDQILKNIDSGAQNPKTEAGVSMGADASSEKTSESITAGSRIAADLVDKLADRAAKTTDLTIKIIKDGTNQINANSAVVSQTEIRGDIDSTQLTTENRPLDIENKLTTNVPNSIDKADADAKQPKEALSFLRDTRNSDRLEFSNRKLPAADYEKQNATESMRDNHPLKQDTPSGMNRNSGKVTERSLQGVSGAEPQSKIFQEAQPAKEEIKAEPGLAEEKRSKVIRTEAGTNENSMLNSPSQNSGKSAETAAPSKEAEAGQSGLRTQTMDQIVRRAVMQLRNGQHEARIDLKPEFLGHIRMQVVSENQQVTVKILAEYGFVKDMIENNAHQLKADLQQHGLEIDKLEVSVSRDSDDSGRPRKNLAESKAKPDASDQNKAPRPEDENLEDKRQATPTTDSAVTVDFFA